MQPTGRVALPSIMAVPLLRAGCKTTQGLSVQLVLRDPSPRLRGQGQAAGASGPPPQATANCTRLGYCWEEQLFLCQMPADLPVAQAEVCHFAFGEETGKLRLCPSSLRLEPFSYQRADVSTSSLHNPESHPSPLPPSSQVMFFLLGHFG